jgi:ADP-ribosylation factor-like protein 3
VESNQELQQLLEDDKLAGVPTLIFANKQDLLQALPADEISDTMNLHLIRDRPWCIMASSAKTGEGLQEGMEWLVQTIQK